MTLGTLQASLEFRGFDIRGFEYLRFVISPKPLVWMSPNLDLAQYRPCNFIYKMALTRPGTNYKKHNANFGNFQV